MQTSSLDLLRRSQVYEKQAALKKGSSIEYVSENRIFTDADDYSMEIEILGLYWLNFTLLQSRFCLHISKMCKLMCKLFDAKSGEIG